MSARESEALGGLGRLRKLESGVIEESFALAPKTVSGNTTANGQRKGVPNSWSGNSEAARTETCADTENKQRDLYKNRFRLL